jgi:hypothetical protein
MEARLTRAALSAFVLAVTVASVSHAAGYRTKNFVVVAQSPQLAKQVAETAENCRKVEAVEWLGSELPDWPSPCPITVHVGPNMGAGGATSFAFINGQPTHWRMTVQGSHARLIDSVIPHEVLHTVFASHFGQPVPRWADEGACTTLEHVSETTKYEQGLIQFLRSNRGIAFSDMFLMTEYPQDMLPLYSQGHSLARYLIMQGGRRKFVTYIEDALKTGDWTRVTAEHYGYDSVKQLQEHWVAWVAQGSPQIAPRDTTAIAAVGHTTPVASAPPAHHANPRMTPIRPVATQARPASNTVATNDGGESWYARGRIRAASNASDMAAQRGAHAYTPGTTTSIPPMQSLTRPQSPQGPGQVVIEGARGGSPRSHGGTYYDTPTYHATPPNGGTMWR